jgi:large subunit ribosomal protein L18
MAKNATYVVKFRRRREIKTDYKKRLKYLKSKKPRFVIRASNKNCVCQVVKYSPTGDVNVATARSVELNKYGYKGNTGNRKAIYLTGYLCAKRSKEKKAIVDMGLQHLHPKGKLYSAIKGAINAGMDISHDESILPDPSIFDDIKPIIEKINNSAGEKKDTKPGKGDTKPEKKEKKTAPKPKVK